MIQHDNGATPYSVGLHDTPSMARLVATLDAVCTPTAPPHAAMLDDAVTRALRAQAAAARFRLRPRAGLRLRLAALAALAAMAGTGALAYLAGQRPTPVSAQAVLSHAAAASRLAPNQAAHLTYTISPRVAGRGGGVAGPLDVWLQADGQGHTAHLAVTFKVFQDNGALAAIQRMVFVRGIGQGYVYDPGTNAVALTPASTRQPNIGGLDLLDPSAVAAYLRRAAQGSSGQAHLLPQQTLNGVTVDVVQVPGNPQHDDPPVTAYFDAQSYLFRGYDVVSGPYILRLRVTAYQLVAASAVPPRTFALDEPSTARIVAHVAIPEFVPGD